ncbi:DNA repair protein RecN [Flavobacteriaceae bacterium Ap0902]|nr:DNA repair protein RecN [Flavobacteriaceae bacterium Ap0902]
MLINLFISNYALIKQLELNFNSGLTTITGETGAGKSILLGALKLVLGERADLHAIKDKEKKCVIEATFDITNLNLEDYFETNDLDYEDLTIFRREILPSGKSRAFVNDVPTKLNVLSTLSSKLIDVHSQFETADLLNPSFQFQWVDAVAGQQAEIEYFRNLLEVYHATLADKKKLEREKSTYQKELDYNEFLHNELLEANLEDFSLEELENEQRLLENAEETAMRLSEAFQILNAEELGVVDLMAQVQLKAKQFSEYLTNSDLKARIDSLLIETIDITSEIQVKLEDIEADPNRLMDVQAKLNQLHTLLQKHQAVDIAELIKIRDDIAVKIKKSFSVEDDIQRLEDEVFNLEKRLNTLAQSIRKKRLEVIPSIEKEITKTLKELGMPDAELKFRLTKSDIFNNFGQEDIQLLFTANKGMPLNLIEKSASGGERSRLMLAIKESVSKNKELPTLILDEIDTGVSGKVAGSIGAVMHRMGKHMQVISITHLPQVAAYGQTHLKVVKSKKDDTTVTSVINLNHQQRIEELAQIMSGYIITDAAKKQAEELLKISVTTD